MAKQWQHRWHHEENLNGEPEITRWFDTNFDSANYFHASIKPGTTIEWREKPHIFQVGDMIDDPGVLDHLPAKAIVVDKYGDGWQKINNFWSFPTALNRRTDRNLLEYSDSVTVVFLPKGYEA